MKKMLFIFNPNAGGGRLKNKLMDILCRFTAAGYRTQVFATQKTGDAMHLARRYAASCDVVVCCGGDGTLNETVSGLMQLPAEDRPEVGYIPSGTTNDFASSLRIPKTDMLAAADLVLSPRRTVRIDVGGFNERAFNYVAAFGAFTDVAYGTPQDFKNVFGYFAYVAEAVHRLPNIHPVRLHIDADGGQVEGEFLFGMISNSRSVGGFSIFSKEDVRMDDGVFELLLIHPPANLSDFGELSAALLTRDTTSSMITAMHLQRAAITGPEPVPWTLDGEFGGSLQQVNVQVHKQALGLRC